MTKSTKHKPLGFEFGFISVAAYRKLTAPPTFRFFRVSSETGGFLLTGSTSSGVYKTGKNKGRPRHDGPARVVIVSELDVIEEERRYQMETGNCYKCVGSGQRSNGWSIETGPRFRPCQSCNATGKAAQ